MKVQLSEMFDFTKKETVVKKKAKKDKIEKYSYESISVSSSSSNAGGFDAMGRDLLFEEDNNPFCKDLKYL